jgi:hypothetical protein
MRYRVQAARALWPNRGESVVPQHLEVLGYGRRRDAELALDHRAERAGGELAAPEQLQDAAAGRIAEYVERVHDAKISVETYISIAFKLMRVRAVLVLADPFVPLARAALAVWPRPPDAVPDLLEGNFRRIQWARLQRERAR